MLFTVTFSFYFVNVSMMDETIDCSNGHHVVAKDAIPLAEGLIGCD